MNKSLLDTDIFSEFLKGRDAQVGAHAAVYLAIFGQLTISTVTLFEIISGWQRRGLRDLIQRVLSIARSDEVVTLSLISAEIAGLIHGDLMRTGQTIGFADPLIAAIAIENGFTLITGNISHYQRIQDLGYPLQLDN